ncbi:protease [Runella rosea]|uniref:Tricorn protease homolog n=1 Tax=Runella rosea TaxID=2259595 RepID=A0A344THC4_9BACT|nr:S41 family peptidase [Runella rosea]AXE18045.1 protease [Runella rosea]
MRFLPFLALLAGFWGNGSHTSAQGTRLLRQPTVSDRAIVFVYADDLWLVDRDGGNAQRLTTHEGTESLPHFSPDGSLIAFSAQYAGNTDVYVIPASGGEPKRLTWHPGEDAVQGWTPDGQSVVFRSGRSGYPTAIAKFFKVNIKGGFQEELPIPQAHAGEISADGQMAAYQTIGFWDPEWRNYRGGQAQPIWIVDLKTLTLKTTPQTDRERHTDPVWYKDMVYFLSERDYANNIWSFNPKTNELKQVTFHKDFDVKSLDASNDRILYEQGGYLHLLDPQTGQAKQLIINVQGDFTWALPRWQDVRPSALLNASLSPTGKRALFEYRGDIFTVPKENGDWRNISHSPGAADRSPVWSPNGQKIAWFSDASGEYQLMISDQEGLEKPRAVALPTPTFYFKPQWSPDSKYISYTDTDYNLWVIEIDGGQPKKIDTERFAHPNRSLNPVWSPDSKWIAYARILDNQHKAIKVYNLETGQTHQLTDGMSDAISPVWDASGKYLYFLASTNFALNTGWLDMSSYQMPVTRGVYMIVLAKGDPSPFLPKSDEEIVEKIEKKEEPPTDDKSKKTDKKGKEAPKKDEKTEPKKGIVVKIDLDGLDQRILALPKVAVKDYDQIIEGPEGSLFFTENIPDQPGFILHKYTLKDQKNEDFLKGIQYAVTAHDRKNLLYRSEGSWGIIATANPPKPGDGKLNMAGMKIQIDPKAEYKQIFREGWRYQRDFLYVNNTHGAPWNDVYQWYSPWIDHVRHRTDLNYVVDILGGEIAVGHSYTSGGDFPTLDNNNPAGLLGADFSIENGLYRLKTIFTGENWNPELRAPLSGPGIDVKEGDYLLEINGVPLTAEMDIYGLLEGTANRQIKIRVGATTYLKTAKLITVVPIANEAQLRTRAWVEGNRRKVSELSNGQLAYVWIPNTGNGGYEYFNRYYFAQQDKKGAVIDERNNGGGSAADYIVDVLARKLQGYFNSRANDHKPFTTPMAGLWGPKVMIINERAGSGGDLMPFLFRQAKVGPLVGTRTWGGLVGTWDTPPFIDGGRMVAPRGGFYDVDGKWSVEGEGIAPDVEVHQDPAKVAKGEDPQLEKSVQVALELLKTQGVTLKPEPEAPIRYKRPQK